MNKQFLFLVVLAILMQGVVSNKVWADGDDPISFIILPPEGGGDAPLPGGSGGDDNGSGEHSDPKSPVQMPTVVQDDYTLYFYSGCAGSILQIRDEFETVVYSTIITDETDEITLPSTLSGTYEIRLIRGSNTFVGEIEL
ncbi:MAG: hypothetical protein K6F20_13545 [Bacteroidaceae bacterium]|nr:hypothetical protein [Bacteroidaceae bacterium]